MRRDELQTAMTMELPVSEIRETLSDLAQRLVTLGRYL
jgi:hypothetical protein